MSDFRQLVAQSCPAQEELALGIACELGASSPELAHGTLRALARELPDGSAPEAQLEALRMLSVRRLRPFADGPILLHEVVRDGHGHPLGVAVALAAIAARAGWTDVGLVGHDECLYLAHRRLGPALVVDPSRPEALLDPHELGVDLSWRCAHETTAIVLGRVVAEAEHSTDLGRSLAASALLLALPVDAAARARQTETHRRLLARLN